jgi:acyl carrier protein
MTDEDFLAEFVGAIGVDPAIVTLDTPLKSSEFWDSVAYLSIMTLVDDRMDVVLDPQLVADAETLREILEKARQG